MHRKEALNQEETCRTHDFEDLLVFSLTLHHQILPSQASFSFM